MFRRDLCSPRIYTRRFRLFNVEIIERIGPTNTRKRSISTDATARSFSAPRPAPTADRQLPDYDRHREPITRPVVFISIIHGGIASFQCSAAGFSETPERRSCAGLAAPGSAAIYITRDTAKSPISSDDFSRDSDLLMPRLQAAARFRARTRATLRSTVKILRWQILACS